MAKIEKSQQVQTYTKNKTVVIRLVEELELNEMTTKTLTQFLDLEKIDKTTFFKTYEAVVSRQTNYPLAPALPKSLQICKNPAIYSECSLLLRSRLGFMRINDPEDPGKETSIEVHDFLRGFLFQYYYFGKSFAALSDEIRGIETLKKFIDFNSDRNRKPESELAELSEMYNTASLWPAQFQGSFDASEWTSEQGRYGLVVKRCKWAETLSELNDPKWAYATACYYDLHAATLMNSNFVLTRKSTIAAGANQCDFCYHDKRKHKIEHPSSEFFDKIKVGDRGEEGS